MRSSILSTQSRKATLTRASHRRKNKKLPKTTTEEDVVKPRLKIISCRISKNGRTSCTKISQCRTTKMAGSASTLCAVVARRFFSGLLNE